MKLIYLLKKQTKKNTSILSALINLFISKKLIQHLRNKKYGTEGQEI